jgi:hypothetical protein
MNPLPYALCPLTVRASGDKLTYRSIPVRAEGPSSMDAATRSVEVVGATEEPVEVYDFERWEVVREVLLMDGCELPRMRQIPLQDTHQRGTTASTLGSYRDMRIDGGQLLGRAFFSTVEEAESPWTKVREGHITDFSVGYRQVESTWIPEGESAVIRGRTFKGPLRVTSRWRPKELSVVPVGADELAKARSAAEIPKPEVTPTQPIKEKCNMNKKLREMLIARGLAETATDEEAWAYLNQNAESLLPQPQERAAATVEQSADQIRRAATGEERDRVLEIDAMCRQFEIPQETTDGFIKNGVSVTNARKSVLETLAQRTPQTPAPVVIVADERDKFRAAAEDALLLRASIKPEDKIVPGARDLAGWTLSEIARHSLRMAGLPTGGSRMEMVGRALVAADFPYLLANVANKALFDGWEQAEETWPEWVGTGSVSDFKTHYLPRVSEADDLLEIPEGSPYKYGERTEAQEQYAIATYGRLFAISRQAIINDDLSALTNIPRDHGDSAKRKIGDVVYAVLTANAAMGDGVALFHSNHGNLPTGADVGTVALAAAIAAMKKQKGVAAKAVLNWRPVYFLAPVALEGAAEVFFRSERFSDTNTIATDSSMASTRVNPYAGSYFTRVYEARLDDSDANAWYLAARKGRTVNVYFLDGKQAPYLETQQGWSVDGVEYKVRIDCGAKALDWRGLVKNAGPS